MELIEANKAAVVEYPKSDWSKSKRPWILSIFWVCVDPDFSDHFLLLTLLFFV
jgi:hypothetical protein